MHNGVVVNVPRPSSKNASVLGTMTVAAVLFAGASGLGLWSASAAFKFLPSLNLSRPALVIPEALSGPAGPRLARRVVFVMIDGLRLDASYGRQFLDSLRDRGVDATARSHFPTMSRPNYVTLVTGVEPKWSGVRTNDHDRPVLLDSMMARARAQGLRVAFVAQSGDGLPTMFPDDLDEGGLAPWPGGAERALANALARGDELILWWILDVDDAGHAFGGASPQYRLAMRRVDDRLRSVLGADKINLGQDTVVVVADHGHIDQGGHGGMEDEVVDVPLIVAGAGVRPGATISDAHLIDIAPTVCALLGLPAPSQAQGRVLVEALDVAPGVALALAAADQARRARIVPLMNEVEDEASRLSWSVRKRRVASVAFLLVGWMVATWLMAGRGILRIDRRVLLIAVPAFPLTFYSMLVVFENWLSPSVLPPEANVTSKLFKYGGVAAVTHLIAAWYALSGRSVPRERLAAAAGLVMLGLILALAPAGLAWTIAGSSPAVVLPGPDVLTVPPVAYAAVGCYAFSAGLTLVVEYAVFLARASDPRPFQASR